MAKKIRLMKASDVGIGVNRFGGFFALKGYAKGPHKDAVMIGLGSRRTPDSVTGRMGGVGLYRFMRRKK